MMETWKSIKGFEGLYEVSNYGEVKALSREVYSQRTGKLHQRRKEQMLQQGQTKRGYKMVSLCKDGGVYRKFVHRLVAEAFIPNPLNKSEVDHIDTNISNNKVDNLRWATRKENSNNPLTRLNVSRSKMGHPFYGIRKEN